MEVLIPTLAEGLPVGQDDEAELYSQRALLLRYLDCRAERRGQGGRRVAQTQRVVTMRLLLRDEEVMEIVSNFYVDGVPGNCELTPIYCRQEGDTVWWCGWPTTGLIKKRLLCSSC